MNSMQSVILKNFWQLDIFDHKELQDLCKLKIYHEVIDIP